MTSLFPAKIPHIVKVLYPKRTWKLDASKRKHPSSVYFTFDDGPIPEVTPWVLDTLKNYNVKASFFCIGDNLRKYPEIGKRILAEGHTLGNHTQHHLNAWKTKEEVYLNDVKLAQHQLDNYPIKDTYFRPPYGKLTSNLAQQLMKEGYKIIMWDILSKDYDATIDEENCLANVTHNLEAGSIVVFHDSLKAAKNLRYVLPKAIENALERGFQLDSL
jgi:peptidoglycan/xylan/chitin deacetylase (PgdA/CDA1 family)